MINRYYLEASIGQQPMELFPGQEPDMLKPLPVVATSFMEIPGKIQEADSMLLGHSEQFGNKLGWIQNVLQDIMTDHHVEMIGGEVNILEPFPIDKLVIGLASIMILADLAAIGLSTYPSGLIHKGPGPGAHIKNSESGLDPIVLATTGSQLQVVFVILGLVVTPDRGILGPIILLVLFLIDKRHLQLADDSALGASSQGCSLALDLGGDSCLANLIGLLLHCLDLITAAYTIDIPHG